MINIHPSYTFPGPYMPISSPDEDSVPIEVEVDGGLETAGIEIVPVNEEPPQIDLGRIELAPNTPTLFNVISEITARLFPPCTYRNDFSDEEDEVEQSGSDDEEVYQIRGWDDLVDLNPDCTYNCMERLSCRQVSRCVPNPARRNDLYNVIISVIITTGVIGTLTLLVLLLDSNARRR